MTRNLKVLGLALIAACAMAAVSASAAQALTPSLFTSDSYPATATTTQEQKIGEGLEYFESIGRKLECEVAHYSGTLSEANSDLTVTPDYTDHTQGGNCRAGGTLVTTVTEEGCTFTFTATENTKVANVSYNVGVDIVCPPTKLITVHVRNLLNNADACTITVETGTATGDLTGTNIVGGGVNIEGEVVVKSIVHSNNTALCGVETGTSKTVETKYVVAKKLVVKAGAKKVSISD
jgi:glutamine cyclotransferase